MARKSKQDLAMLRKQLAREEAKERRQEDALEQTQNMIAYLRKELGDEKA